MASSQAEADGQARIAKACVDNGDFAQARTICEDGLRKFPGHPSLTEILASLSQKYNVEKAVMLTPSLDPAVGGGTQLAAGTQVDATDVVVFKGVTRMKASCDDGSTGWLDFRDEHGQKNVGMKYPRVQQSRLSAQQAVQDCVMSGYLHKKGSVFWKKRFFVIAPQWLSPAHPDRYLHYYESDSESVPKDTVRLETCRAAMSQEKAHSLYISIGEQRAGRPDHYLVAADSSAHIKAWKQMLDKFIAGESSVPAVFQQQDHTPPPVDPPQPEPEAVVVPPEDHSWIVNPQYASSEAAGEVPVPPLERPPPSGFDYLFEDENRIIEDNRQREEAARLAAEEEARRIAAEEEARRVAAEEEAARLAAEEAERQRLEEEEAARLAAEEAERRRLEEERLAREREEKSVGKWLAETCGVDYAEGGSAFRELYESGFEDQHIHEFEQLRSMAPDAVQVVLGQVVPAEMAEHRQLIMTPLEAIWAAEQAAIEAERQRREEERLARLAAEEAERQRLEEERLARLAAEEAERQRLEEERLAQLAAEAEARRIQEEEREAERQRVEAERLRLLAAEKERARVERLQRKIDNLTATNDALQGEPQAAGMVESNKRDIARLQAEIAGAPPPVEVVPAPVPSPVPSPVPAPAPAPAEDHRVEEQRRRLQRKIDNLTATNDALAGEPQAAGMVESNKRDIARLQAEIAALAPAPAVPPPVYQPPADGLGGPPGYHAPVAGGSGGGPPAYQPPALGSGGGAGPPAYQPPAVGSGVGGGPPAYQAPAVGAGGGGAPAYQPPPQYHAPVVPAPAPEPLSSADSTYRLLGVEQVKQSGANGLSADMLSGRLTNLFGATLSKEDLIRLVGACCTGS